MYDARKDSSVARAVKLPGERGPNGDDHVMGNGPAECAIVAVAAGTCKERFLASPEMTGLSCPHPDE
jgi:hypothetical protein